MSQQNGLYLYVLCQQKEGFLLLKIITDSQNMLGLYEEHSRPVNLHPLFLKIGHPAFCKKQAEKNRVILYSKREETRLPLLFFNYNDLGFLHSVFFSKNRVGCPIFKNSGCRLTGRLCTAILPIKECYCSSGSTLVFPVKKFKQP